MDVDVVNCLTRRFATIDSHVETIGIQLLLKKLVHAIHEHPASRLLLTCKVEVVRYVPFRND